MDKYFYMSFYTKNNVTNSSCLYRDKGSIPLGDAQDEQHWQRQWCGQKAYYLNTQNQTMH